jgi:hypothetical protein
MDGDMKIPRWNGSERPTTYIVSLLCFLVGFAVVTVLSFGRVTHDDREGAGWNPISKMPDGKVGLSEFAIDTIGFLVLGLCLALLVESGAFVRSPPPQTPFGDITIKSRSDDLQIRQ